MVEATVVLETQLEEAETVCGSDDAYFAPPPPHLIFIWLEKSDYAIQFFSEFLWVTVKTGYGNW